MTKVKEVNIGKNVFQLDTVNAVKVLFRKLAHAPKLRILQKIAEAPEGGICVQDIYKAKSIRLGQSHASIMLGELRDANLVKTERRGKNIFYTINEDTFKVAKEICDAFQKIKQD